MPAKLVEETRGHVCCRHIPHIDMVSECLDIEYRELKLEIVWNVLTQTATIQIVKEI